MSENEEDKGPSRVDLLMDAMEEKFQMDFFSKDDVKAACAVGALMSYATYMQETEFDTKGLSKVVSRTFDHMNEGRLQTMMSAASSVLFKLQSRSKKYVSTKHRALASELMAEADWESTPEELQLAFILGYDLYNKVRSEE